MKGVISAGHNLTANAGIAMMKMGGNAFDAAVAATFASFVCESALTSIGGGGFFMAHSSSGETVLYDFFPNVPGKGRNPGERNLHFFPVDIDFTGTVQQFHIGRGAAAVPGCMVGLDEVYKRHCTLPLQTLVSPAVRYAREGVVLNSQQAYFNRILSPILTISDEGRNVYAPNGRVLAEGETIFKRDMACTIERLASEGLKTFYEGEIASGIVQMFENGGLITEGDLKSYSVEIRKPLEIIYRDRIINTNPPPSSGGCLIAFALNLIGKYDLKAMGHNGYSYLRTLFDVMRITDEARGEDFDHKVYDQNIVETFLSEENIEIYRKKLGADERMPDTYEKPATGNTTHISVIDEKGNAASVTTSNGEGCGYIIPGTGVMMNNMLGEEDINPHGFHIQSPGARMSSMMSPTVVMKGGTPEIVLGSGGSNRIRNAIFQVILNIIDHKFPVSRAVNLPRVHWDGRLFQLEKGVEIAEQENLESEGIPVNGWQEKNMYFGGVHTVVRDAESGEMSGAGDLRRGGVCLKFI